MKTWEFYPGSTIPAPHGGVLFHDARYGFNPSYKDKKIFGWKNGHNFCGPGGKYWVPRVKVKNYLEQDYELPPKRHAEVEQRLLAEYKEKDSERVRNYNKRFGFFGFR
jgi:hypothetical protein